MSDRPQRRLAAIVAADVAGYSRMIGLDEEGTLEALRSARHDVVEPLLREYRGRIANTAGDSLLIEFTSAVDAVRYAIASQEALMNRAGDVAKDRRLLLRVGIHVGDVVAEGTDLLGDGVNVAARLEGLAEPGGIAISDDAHRQVRDRVAVDWQDAGHHQLKNIARLVQVWRWSLRHTTTDVSKTARPGNASTIQNRPSVAVLPFRNMSSDPEKEFFTDGIAEDIITALAKISRMRVIARHSTAVYRDRTIDPRQIAAELDVRYVLEGSIRSGGSRLRITAQLIDATDGSHIWADRYDRTEEDLFDVQDQITKEIVAALQMKLTDGEVAHVMARGTNNIEAWQLCVRGTEIFMRFNTTDYVEARQLAEAALKHDPNYAYAWATLGFTYWWEGRLGYAGDPQALFLRADDIAHKAMNLDDTVSWAIGLAAMVAAPRNRHDEGVTIARRGVELHPGNADVRAFLAFTLMHSGQNVEAVEHYRAAMALNPYYPNWYRAGLSRSLCELGQFKEAMALCDEILLTEKAFLPALLRKAYILIRMDQADAAADVAREITRVAPSFRVAHIPGMLMSKHPEPSGEFSSALRQVGLPE